MKRVLSFLCCSIVFGQVETVQVQSGQPERKVHLTGELLPYESVELYARANGYVERVLVDRGSAVRAGQLLITLSAPELQAQVAEAESRVQVIESQRAEAEARLASAQSTYDRLRKASETAGAIAPNELVTAEKSVAAAKASVASLQSSKQAAESSLNAVRQTLSYLHVTAPFNGTVTERRVHPGALVGPGQNSSGMLRIDQTSTLRLTAAVPETYVGSIVRGAAVSFTVPAYPGETFTGRIARVPSSLDAKTRTMPVELDVRNSSGKLAAGMYPDVSWPVRRRASSLLVPSTAVATTTERTFVIRVSGNRAEWVDVRKGATVGDQVEVTGNLRAGDIVVRRASDELRNGSTLNARRPSVH